MVYLHNLKTEDSANMQEARMFIIHLNDKQYQIQASAGSSKLKKWCNSFTVQTVTEINRTNRNYGKVEIALLAITEVAFQSGEKEKSSYSVTAYVNEQ